MILLVAIIAAIALTLRQRKDSKHIDPADAGPGAGARPPAASCKMPPSRPAQPDAAAAAAAAEETKA